MVLWGKKRLGIIAPHQPLILQRPRDSGPMDLIVQSEGYVTVQTRAYTFADTKLAVKLTPIDQKKTLLGYRQEVPSPDAGALPSPDAGARPRRAPCHRRLLPRRRWAHHPRRCRARVDAAFPIGYQGRTGR